MGRLIWRETLVAIAVAAFVQSVAAGEYRKRVRVREPTRLDWTYAVSSRSVADPPPEWVKHVYESSDQIYEFYGPAEHAGRRPIARPPKQGYPLILFVSHKGKAIGWEHWEPICRRRGFLFAGPNGTYKGDLHSLRIRIVMDVLHDVRKRFPIDADRTYICGFYRNANIASTIAARLPEYFGGLIAIAGGASLPQDFWPRRKVSQRLSVVHLVGTQDNPGLGNQVVGMVRRSIHPSILQTGTRSRLSVYPGRVHLMPPRTLLAKSVQFLEADLPRRRELAAAYPSTSISDAPTRADHAQRVLTDATHMLDDDEKLIEALSMLEEILQRWTDVPAATTAKAILRDFDAADGPWSEHLRQQRQREHQRRVAMLRSRMELDPPKGSHSFAPEYRLAFWDDSASHDTEGSLPPYDDVTKKVIKRLGSRVRLDANDRVIKLNLSGTRVTARQLRHFKEQLHGMRELQVLDLSHTVMRESTLNQIADLEGLKSLGLAGVTLTNLGMQHLSQMKQLRFLSLAGTDVGSQGLSVIPSFAELQCLDLGGTRVNNAVLEHLTQSPRLVALSLAACGINDENAHSFGSLTALRYLNLGSTDVSDATCLQIAKLEHLSNLQLDYTKVKDSGVVHLARLGNLHSLSLLGTRIGDESLSGLSSLTALRKLNVRSTKVTAEGVTELTEELPTLQVRWDGDRRTSVAQQRKELETQFKDEPSRAEKRQGVGD